MFLVFARKMVFLFFFFFKDFFTRINKDGNFFSIKKEKRIQFEIKRRYREFFFFFEEGDTES